MSYTIRKAQIVFIFMLIAITNDLLAQTNLNVMSYNLLNYPYATGGLNYTRNNDFAQIVAHNGSDLILAVEINTELGNDSLVAALNRTTNKNFERAEYYHFGSYGLGNMLFYDADKFGLLSQTEIYALPRDISHYHLFVKEDDLACHQDTIFLDLFAVHLKASDGSSNIAQRATACQNLINYIDNLPAESNVIVGGDFNFYNDNEDGYDILLDTNNQQVLNDVVGQWVRSTYSYRRLFTQSTRSSSYTGTNGGASGGLDDRFDFQFMNDNLINGNQGISYNLNSYEVFGNDGYHYNKAIIDPNVNVPSGTLNNDISDDLAYALFDVSDHFPIITQYTIDDVTCDLGVQIALDVWLEGAYDASNNNMQTILLDENVLALSQPFDVSPYFYNGVEMLANTADFPTNTVDWLLVELRDATNNTQIVARKAALLLADGSVVNIDGTMLSFENGTSNEAYFVVVRHRNHLDIMSSNAILFSTNTTYDMSISSNVMGGTGQLQLLSNGKSGLLAGDFNSSGQINFTDTNVYFGEVSALNQYLISDCSFDAISSVRDMNFMLKNIGKQGISQIQY
ncbi:MAG: hypothetical protein ACPG5B_07985 [Chitinophagales bacterium]